MTQGTEGSTQVQKAPVKASGGLDFWLGASLSWYSLETGIRQSCAWGGGAPRLHLPSLLYGVTFPEEI